MDENIALAILKSLLEKKRQVTIVSMMREYKKITGQSQSISWTDFAIFLNDLNHAKKLALIGFDQYGRGIYEKAEELN